MEAGGGPRRAGPASGRRGPREWVLLDALPAALVLAPLSPPPHSLPALPQLRLLGHRSFQGRSRVEGFHSALVQMARAWTTLERRQIPWVPASSRDSPRTAPSPCRSARHAHCARLPQPHRGPRQSLAASGRLPRSHQRLPANDCPPQPRFRRGKLTLNVTLVSGVQRNDSVLVRVAKAPRSVWLAPVPSRRDSLASHGGN